MEDKGGRRIKEDKGGGRRRKEEGRQLNFGA